LYGAEASTQNGVITYNAFTDSPSFNKCLTVVDGNLEPYIQTAVLIAFTTGGGVSNNAVLKSFDADGFTLTWTKAGSPTGTLTVAYLALR
jgi:hypothetical protein